VDIPLKEPVKFAILVVTVDKLPCRLNFLTPPLGNKIVKATFLAKIEDELLSKTAEVKLKGEGVLPFV